MLRDSRTTTHNNQSPTAKPVYILTILSSSSLVDRRITDPRVTQGSRYPNENLKTVTKQTRAKIPLLKLPQLTEGFYLVRFMLIFDGKNCQYVKLCHTLLTVSAAKNLNDVIMVFQVIN